MLGSKKYIIQCQGRQTTTKLVVEELRWWWSKDEGNHSPPTTGQGLREWVGSVLFSRKEASEMGPKNERKGYHQEMKTKVEETVAADGRS